MSSNYDIIKEAIKQKLQIHAHYNGHSWEMCPHVLGFKDGRRQALFYQFGGTSSSGLEPLGSPKNWRCIPIDKLTKLANPFQSLMWNLISCHP